MGTINSVRGALLAASFLASPALAQQGVAAAAPNEAASDEIIVTAQRVAERLQDVPLAVTPSAPKRSPTRT
jgi:iron complex outermembrane receptor protein